MKGTAQIRGAERGFSVLEMIFASAILMFGILAVAQMVPASLQTSATNRFDTMATVIAQRELDQMLSQPISAGSFTDADGRLISLGGAGPSGSPVMMVNGVASIDFSTDPVDGFSIPDYVDPNDPTAGAIFELRWAVIPQISSGTVVSKRIIIACRRVQTGTPALPVNLDSWLQKF